MFINRTDICFKIKHYLSLYSLATKYKIDMNVKLSQKQIGQRIAGLRKMKGLSQEELAKSLRMSRPSLAQIELGNRSVDILEFQKLSQVLRFSLDDFMSKDFNLNTEMMDKDDLKSRKVKERISKPTLQVKKFKNTLLYFLERCAGKPNVGETVLYKLLYFSDFNYYELYEEHLSGARYRKLPFGPVPHRLDSIINQMIETGEIERIKVPYFDKVQTKYIPLVSADLKTINGAEKKVIDKVIEQFGDWSATAISNYSHKDMPWLATKEGEEINYELAFYRDAPYSVRNYRDEIEE